MTGVATNDVGLELMSVFILASSTLLGRVYRGHLHQDYVLAIVLVRFAIGSHLYFLVVLLQFNQILQLVLLRIRTIVLWKVIVQLRSYIPIEDQVMRQVKEEKCLENRDVLSREDPALLEIIDEV